MEFLSALSANTFTRLRVKATGTLRRTGQGSDAGFFRPVWKRSCLPRPTQTAGGFARSCGPSLPLPGKQLSIRGRSETGRGQTHPGNHVLEAEGRYIREMADHLTPERVFDRSWTMTLLGSVLDQLRREYDDAGRLEIFDKLKDALIEGGQATPYATIAARLGSSEGAVRVAAHRLRRRYGILLRQQIAATVGDPAEVDDEIRALFGHWGRELLRRRVGPAVTMCVFC